MMIRSPDPVTYGPEVDDSDVDLSLFDPKRPLSQKMADWKADPVLFAKEGLKMELAKWQRGFLRAVRDCQRVTCRAGRGVGKSAAVCALILWWFLLRTPAKVLITAPKKDQIEDIIWLEVDRWRGNLPASLRKRVKKQKDIMFLDEDELTDLNVVLPRTSRQENTDALRGYHDPNMLIIFEESSGIPNGVFVVAEGSMSTPGARSVAIGNMSRTSGYFYNTHFRDPRWARIHVNGEDLAKEDLSWFDPSYVADMAAGHGVNSDEYKVEVRGDPPSGEEHAVITLEAVQEASRRDVVQMPGYRVVWGVDVGGGGKRDKSVLAKRRGNRQMEPTKSYVGLNVTQLSSAIAKEYRRIEDANPDELPMEINVDTTGVGAGVYSNLLAMGLPARSIQARGLPMNPAEYSSIRHELWYLSKDWIENEASWLDPEDEALQAELVAVHVDVDRTERTGLKFVEEKQVTRRRLGHSTDHADAWNLTFATPYDRVADEFLPKELRRHRRKPPEIAVSWLSA